MCLLEMNSVYSSNHEHERKKKAMPGPNPVPLVAKKRNSSFFRGKYGRRQETNLAPKVALREEYKCPYGRTGVLNTDVAIMRTGYESISTKVIGIARGDEIGRERGTKTYR